MSKRFGRNQKRRLVQELAQLQEVNKTHVEVAGTQISENARLRASLRDAEAVLGLDNPAFRANRMEARRPTRFDPMAEVLMRNGSYAHPMTMKLDDRPVLHLREQAHVILTYKHHRWGYAITEQALRFYPREILARHMAEEFTHMVLDELNKLGVRHGR